MNLYSSAPVCVVFRGQVRGIGQWAAARSKHAKMALLVGFPLTSYFRLQEFVILAHGISSISFGAR